MNRKTIKTVIKNDTFSKNMVLFSNFASKYDLNDEEINGKYLHTFRVAEICAEIAKNLGLNTQTAFTIGLLHDYSRFEQWSKYKSFRDYAIVDENGEIYDHADKAAELLFEQGHINDFEFDPEDFLIIYLSIKFHNKPEIDEAFILNQMKRIPQNKHSFETIMNYCKLIRDSDKMDLLNRIGYGDLKFDSDKDGVTPSVLKRVQNHKFVYIAEMKTKLDRVLSFIGFLYDLNFIESIEQIDLNTYFDAIRTHYGTHLTKEDNKILEDVIKDTKKYFESQSSSKKPQMDK